MVKTVLRGMVLVLALALAGPTVAQDEVAVSAGLDVVSDYIWRGQLLNDDGAAQPWVNVGYGAFTFNLWGSVDIDDTPNDAQWEFTEVDLTASYSVPVGEFYGLDLGVIYYDFPNTGGGNTLELFATFTFLDVAFTPFVSLYYDIDAIEGFYLQAGGSYGQDMETWSWNLVLSVAAGSEDYNTGYFGVADFGLNDVTAKFTATYPVMENLDLTASVTGSLMLSDVGDAVAEDSNFGLGVGASYSF